MKRLIIPLLLLCTPLLAQVHIQGVASISPLASIPGQDVGAQVNAAIQLCPDGCKINIDAGDFVFSTPLVINRVGLQIMGAGGRATRLHFRGQGVGIEMRTNPFVIDSHNLLQGISIDVENGNTALLTGDLVGATFRDLYIGCASQPGTVGILAQLSRGWFERNQFDSVDVKYCAQDIVLNVDPASEYTSFGYNKFLQVGLNLSSGEKGFVVGSRAVVYGSVIDINVNVDSGGMNDGTEAFCIWGVTHANTIQLVGESTNPIVGLHVYAGGDFTQDGQISLANMSTINVPASIGPGWVNIVSKVSGKCLDIIHASSARGTELQQWDCTGRDNQKFQFTPVQGGYQITAKNSGLQLDVIGGPTAIQNGVRIQQWPFSGGSNEVWRVIPASDGYYSIIATHSSKCLDLAASASSVNGDTIQQWTCLGADNQSWRLSPAQ